jgi:hypothetical protein
VLPPFSAIFEFALETAALPLPFCVRVVVRCVALLPIHHADDRGRSQVGLQGRADAAETQHVTQSSRSKSACVEHWSHTLTSTHYANCLELDLNVTVHFQVDLTRTFRFRSSEEDYEGVPIMAANMDTVGTFEMAVALNKVRRSGFLHGSHLTWPRKAIQMMISFCVPPNNTAQMFHDDSQALHGRRVGQVRGRTSVRAERKRPDSPSDAEMRTNI